MPVFQVGQTITTQQPEVEVTVSPDNPLPIGKLLFQLVVDDEAGNSSKPAVVEIIVRDTQAPTAVIDAPSTVEFGQTFKLSGARSSDVPPGKVVAYHWTLLPTPTPLPIPTPLPLPTPIPSPLPSPLPSPVPSPAPPQ